MRLSLIRQLFKVVLPGAACLFAHAQGRTSQTQTPETASVTVSSLGMMNPGQKIVIQFVLKPAPKGYTGVKLNWGFHNIQPVKEGQDLGMLRGSAGGSVDLNDHQSVYTVSLLIAGDMTPGKWKLMGLSFRAGLEHGIKILNDVTFEIAPLPPLIVHLEAPSIVVAGQRLRVRINLEKSPEDIGQNCMVALETDFQCTTYEGKPVSPDGPFCWLPSTMTEINPGRTTYEAYVSPPVDYPGDKWRGNILIRQHPNDNQPCRIPKLEGDTQFAFEVKPSTTLVTPTSADVTINPSQIQLFLGEADRLRAEVLRLREQLTSGTVSASLLSDTVQQALKDVDKTQAKFGDLGSGLSPEIAGVFFDQIRLGYSNAIGALRENTAALRGPAPRIELVGVAPHGPATRLSGASEAVLNSIAHNADAYALVASTKVLTFVLNVISEPDGATISYKLEGDDYQTFGQSTVAQIPNLTRGVYSVKLERPGCSVDQVTVDAMEVRDPVVNRKLVCKRGAR